jgi:ParB family chromosome partitioning protein
MELNLDLDAFTQDNITLIKEDKDKIIILPHSRIIAGEQIRKTFKNIKELSINIESIGVLQPIIIENEPNKQGLYKIIDGERRWRACALINFDIPCIRRDDSKNFQTIQLIANLHRENLSIIEECNGIKELQKKLHAEFGDGFNLQQLAIVIGKDNTWVSRRLKIANSEEEFKSILNNNNIESLTMADNLEKVYKLKPKIAQKLAETGANREEIKKKLKTLKRGINTRVKIKKAKIKTPIVSLINEEINLISLTQAINKDNKIININLSDIKVTGVK